MMWGMGERRRYNDEDRLAALAALRANAGNLKKTAREVGVPRKTLAEWAAAVSATGGEASATPPPPLKTTAQRVAERLPDAESDLAARFERIARKALGVARKKVGELNAKDAVIAAATAVDKMRLLRGESTSNHTHRLDLSRLTDEQLENLDRLAALAYGSGVGEVPALP